MTTPEQVAATFSRCTGIRLRYLSHNQFHLCAEFVKHFTLAELEQVIGYVQKLIRAGRLDERSLAFRNIMGEHGAGNEFQSFQDRLAMSQKTVRTRPEPRQVPTATRVDEANVIVTFQPEPEPDVEPIREQALAGLGALRRAMKGGAA